MPFEIRNTGNRPGDEVIQVEWATDSPEMFSEETEAVGMNLICEM
jgi:hypothetical protein